MDVLLLQLMVYTTKKEGNEEDILDLFQKVYFRIGLKIFWNVGWN